MLILDTNQKTSEFFQTYQNLTVDKTADSYIKLKLINDQQCRKYTINLVLQTIQWLTFCSIHDHMNISTESSPSDNDKRSIKALQT